MRKFQAPKISIATFKSAACIHRAWKLAENEMSLSCRLVVSYLPPSLTTINRSETQNHADLVVQAGSTASLHQTANIQLAVLFDLWLLFLRDLDRTITSQ